MSSNKQELRLRLKATRSALTASERDSAADALCNRVQELPFYPAAKTIALYWPHDDEINTLPLLHIALQQNKTCGFPVLLIETKQKLTFASYTPQTPLLKNRYGILEPDLELARIINLANLDVIFVPVVGFDRQGHRLGRGGGFYDATFAELQDQDPLKWPYVVGLAYACQEIDAIPTDHWDWHMDAIVTEKELLLFK